MLEYYYEDALRWSYGFDNPNKAAVLFACGLPLFWLLWIFAWRIRLLVLRVPAILLTAALVLTDGFLLFKTYSRGGIVAAGIAVVYLLAWEAWTAKPWTKAKALRGIISNSVLVITLGVVLCELDLTARIAQPLEREGDASVENRLVLWKSAVQMAADNPLGFGAGKSGAAYMDWYQPLEMSAGYRTMVNSYLTALVEWGWPLFALAILAAAAFWGWARPGRPGTAGFEVAAGLRAVLLAFALAGFFSTTMEAWPVWIFPGLAALTLAIWACAQKLPLRRAWGAVAIAAALCAGIFAWGSLMSRTDREHRTFLQSSASEMVVLGKSAGSEKWVMVPDAAVLGESPGKLLRALALEGRVELEVQEMASGRPEQLIAAGSAVAGKDLAASKRMILLAPAVLQPDEAKKLIAAAPDVTIFLPEIDEDGRVAFWQEMVAGNPHVKCVTLEGVGTQIDWGWQQVVDYLRQRKKSAG